MTRRHFVAASATLPFTMKAFARNPVDWLLIGTGTDKGIFRATFDPANGTIGTFEVAATTSHPTYLALHPNLPVLYSANELPQGDGQVSSFRLDRSNATLTPLSAASTRGNGPCYVSVDHSGQTAFAANYGGGSLSFIPLVSGGAVNPHTELFECKGNPACGALGPQKDRQDAPHMHCAVVSPDNRFVLACNLGEDAIEVFPIRPGRLPVSIDSPQRIGTRPGSGPRHLAFHPNGRWLYCIYELDCTVELFDWAAGMGSARARPGSVVSTLPAGVATNATSPHPNTGCEIAISPDGRFLYANTRGANTLAVYRIDTATGLLTEQQRIGTGGDIARQFTFDPSRRWLLCANQGSSTITVFAHDPVTARLSATAKSYALDIPMFLLFV
jgi:6-phosphogluconolactonase